MLLNVVVANPRSGTILRSGNSPAKDPRRPAETLHSPAAISPHHVDIGSVKLYRRGMQTLPIKSERLAELEEFARRRGKTPADALDEALAEYLERERQNYQEAVQAVQQGVEDVKAGRTKPAEEYLDEFARKHGLPR